MGVGGVPAQTRVFGFQSLDAALEFQHERLQLGYTCLEPLAVGAFGSRCISHAPVEYAKAESKSIRFSKSP